MRVTPFSETSAVATLFTRDYGKVQAIAKGLKRPRSRLEGALNLFCQYEILFIPKKGTGLATLTECTLLRRFSGIASDLSRFYSACFATELVWTTVAELDPQPALLELLLETFERLEIAPEPRVLALAFAVKAMRLLGFFPDLASCSRCSKAVDRRSRVLYSLKDEGFICEACESAAGGGIVFPLSGGSRAFLARFLEKPLSAVEKMRFDANARIEIENVVKCVLESFTERTLKSIEFLFSQPGRRQENR